MNLLGLYCECEIIKNLEALFLIKSHTKLMMSFIVITELQVAVSLDVTNAVIASDLTVTCEWDMLPMAKTLSYYRRTAYTGKQLIASFTGNNTVQDTNLHLASISPQDPFINFTMKHYIIVRNLTDKDEGDYWCSVNIENTEQIYLSQEVYMKVFGKLLKYVGYMMFVNVTISLSLSPYLCAHSYQIATLVISY